MIDRESDDADRTSDDASPLAQLGLLGWDSSRPSSQGLPAGRHRAASGRAPTPEPGIRRRGRVIGGAGAPEAGAEILASDGQLSDASPDDSAPAPPATDRWAPPQPAAPVPTSEQAEVLRAAVHQSAAARAADRPLAPTEPFRSADGPPAGPGSAVLRPTGSRRDPLAAEESPAGAGLPDDDDPPTQVLAIPTVALARQPPGPPGGDPAAGRQQTNDQDDGAADTSPVRIPRADSPAEGSNVADTAADQHTPTPTADLGGPPGPAASPDESPDGQRTGGDPSASTDRTPDERTPVGSPVSNPQTAEAVSLDREAVHDPGAAGTPVPDSLAASRPAEAGTPGAPVPGSPASGAATSGAATSGAATSGVAPSAAPIAAGPTPAASTPGGPILGASTSGGPTQGDAVSGDLVPGGPTFDGPTSGGRISGDQTPGGPASGGPALVGPLSDRPASDRPAVSASTPAGRPAAEPGADDPPPAGELAGPSVAGPRDDPSDDGLSDDGLSDDGLSDDGLRGDGLRDDGLSDDDPAAVSLIGGPPWAADPIIGTRPATDPAPRAAGPLDSAPPTTDPAGTPGPAGATAASETAAEPRVADPSAGTYPSTDPGLPAADQHDSADTPAHGFAPVGPAPYAPVFGADAYGADPLGVGAPAAPWAAAESNDYAGPHENTPAHGYSAAAPPAPAVEPLIPGLRHEPAAHPDLVPAGYEPQQPAPPTGYMPAPEEPAPAQQEYEPEPVAARAAPAQINPSQINPESLLPTPLVVPDRGWRRAVYRLTSGAVNPGPSAAQRQRQDWVDRARAPLSGGHRVAVLSLKGGVGKTTTTVGIGATLASLRGDRVIAVDASPDRGTLGGKIPRDTTTTVRDLLDEQASISRYVDVRRYVSQDRSRLEVLASDDDPEVSQAFSDADYRAVDSVLERYYSIIVTDCGPGMLHSAMHAVLSLTDTLVVVSTASVDGASSASATLDWLDAHGYGDLARESVTVISTAHALGPQVDVDLLEQHFAARTREVVRVPYDTHLAGGGYVDLARLHPSTSDAYLRISASVVDRFREKKG